MAKFSRLKILLIILIIFFELQFLSHFLQTLASSKTTADNSRIYKLSHLFFPFEVKTTFKYAFSILEKGIRTKDADSIEKGVKYLNKILRANMLHYQAHFYLGKALLSQNSLQRDTFTQALTSLKRAARIRGENLNHGIETVTIFLSLIDDPPAN